MAFSDQDDVWLPGKLARGVAALGSVSAGVPALYCARQRLVDAALRPVGMSPVLPVAPSFGRVLAGNVATGCTVMLNAEAARLASVADPPSGVLHDWWACLLVTGAGGVVVADREAVILYRQHGGNAVGSPAGRGIRAVAALRRGPGRFMTVFRANLAGLRAVEGVLTAEARGVVRGVSAALEGGVAGRVRAVGRYGLGRDGWGESALFAAWFVFG